MDDEHECFGAWFSSCDPLGRCKSGRCTEVVDSMDVTFHNCQKPAHDHYRVAISVASLDSSNSRQYQIGTAQRRRDLESVTLNNAKELASPSGKVGTSILYCAEIRIRREVSLR